MSITVVAYFNKGKSTPFPSSIDGIGGEGTVYYPDSNQDVGGIIVTAYDTEDVDMLVKAFKEHLSENDLSLICIHRVGESKVYYSKTSEYIF